MADPDRSARFTLSSAAGLVIEKKRDIQRRLESAARDVAYEEGRMRAVAGGSRRDFAPPRSADRPPDRKLHLVDVDGLVIGRAAMTIASLLRGKHKVGFTPHVDCGDRVVVINADKIRFASGRSDHKVYYKRASLLGNVGLGSRTGAAPAGPRMRSDMLLEKAVERMMPRGPLGRQQLRNLRIFAGAEHDFTAERPQELNLATIGDDLRRTR